MGDTLPRIDVGRRGDIDRERLLRRIMFNFRSLGRKLSFKSIIVLDPKTTENRKL